MSIARGKPGEAEVPLKDLYSGIQVAVTLVDLHGAAYWPVFERLEREIDERESRKARLDRFRAAP